jgi:maltooligosyltrehalose trehalohydrolase
MDGDPPGPPLGVTLSEEGARFALWTRTARQCAVWLSEPAGSTRTLDLAPTGGGHFERDVSEVPHGTRYAFVLDGAEVRDPYATWLPDGVDAPAMVWRTTHAWRHPCVSRPLRDHVLYELHVGTFTPEGTYDAARERLPYLRDLGVTTIELMPLGSFAGRRGWGYDVVAHYAPFAPYGDPDALRAFVDAAHGLGLSVLLDVVYNHFGPAGNVLPRYAAEYFDAGQRTPWGDAPSFGHPAMRRYIVGNARTWLEEFRFDGLRLDAVHAMGDPSPRHILGDVARAVAELSPKRLLIAEDDRNRPRTVTEDGFDAVWADDFHHQVRVALTGERDGYYAAYQGTAADLADTIMGGWFYRGARYAITDAPRGEPAPELPAEAFVYCLQNHDQVGNRAEGDRITRAVSLEAFRGASMLLLFLPMTPLLFMGQEWAASSPFLYFTDHEGGLGERITEGRRREFARFAAFADPSARARIPDPQASVTFERSRLDWDERGAAGHADVLSLYRAMLHLRRSDPVFRASGRAELRARAVGELLVVERWSGRSGRRLVWNLGTRPRRGEDLDGPAAHELLLTSEDTASAGELLAPGAARIVSYVEPAA